MANSNLDAQVQSCTDGQPQEDIPPSLQEPVHRQPAFTGPPNQEHQRRQRRPTEGMLSPYNITLPALLTGPICYVDVAIQPDDINQLPRPAGLGVFIFYNQVHPHQTVYIQGTVLNATSVALQKRQHLHLGLRLLPPWIFSNQIFYQIIKIWRPSSMAQTSLLHQTGDARHSLTISSGVMKGDNTGPSRLAGN